MDKEQIALLEELVEQGVMTRKETIHLQPHHLVVDALPGGGDPVPDAMPRIVDTRTGGDVTRATHVHYEAVVELEEE